MSVTILYLKSQVQPLAMIKELLMLTFFFIKCSREFSQGGTISRCTNLLPNHGSFVPQESLSPFSILLSKTEIKDGERMQIAILSPTSQRPFRGFFIQARALSDDANIVGEFVHIDISSDYNLLNCSGAGTTATNANNNLRNSLVLEWQAPEYFIGSIRFHVTIVENFATFWVNQMSERIDPFGNVEITSSIGPATTSYPDIDGINIYDGCDKIKTCFGIPSLCVNSQNCETIGAVTYDSGVFIFEIRSPVGANYVALALSHDDRMGSDSVMECVLENGIVRAYTSWTDGRLESPRTGIDQNIIKLHTGWYENGMIYCKVERDAVTTIRDVKFDLINDKHYLLLASGTLLRSDSVGNHNINRDASDQALLLTAVSIVRGQTRILHTLHGTFMIIAWIGTASIGIFSARFCKKTWVDSKLCGKDIWYVIHQTCMSFTWFITITSFIIIFVDLSEWRTSTHSVVGIITIVLCFIQPFGAIFRPAPKHKNRSIFNFMHLLIGNSTHLLAVITIFFSINISFLPDWTIFILTAYVCFYAIFYIILTVMNIMSANKLDNLSVASTVKLSSTSSDAPFSTARKVLLSFFVLVIFLFVIAIVVVTVLAPF